MILLALLFLALGIGAFYALRTKPMWLRLTIALWSCPIKPDTLRVENCG